jgi:membrane peptidoglycan carboxypeptidase
MVEKMIPDEPQDPQKADGSTDGAGGEQSSADDEITREIKVSPNAPPEPEESKTGKPSERVMETRHSSEWVNEMEMYGDESKEPDQAGRAEIPDMPGEDSADWWGGAPFTPMDELDDEDTQPIFGVTGPGFETRAARTQADEPTGDETSGKHPGSQAGTGRRRASDDIPTVPPPNAPPDWTHKSVNLPRPVSEIDRQATRVTPSAYQPAQHTAKNSASTRNARTGRRHQKGRRPSELNRPKKPLKKKNIRGCLLKTILILGFLFILAILVAGSYGIYQYFRISSSLPDVDELRENAAQFETTRILDRDGNVLYEILDPNAGRRTYVSLEDISPYLIAATIATEDKDFFTNPGFDLWAMARALWQNYTSGEIQSGASTITQQLARALLMDPDERYEQTYARKAREIVLAYKITQQYSKEEILELYLNENNYANLAYGIEAAAETYFNTSADSLNLWQASFLAGIPQGPAIYDIYTNREATLNRHRTVLVLMYELSDETGCIDVGSGRPPVCVTFEEATQAGLDLDSYTFPELEINIEYPHWVVYVKTLLEEQFDPQTIYRSGFTVYTTLDPDLQAEAERIVAEQVDALESYHATNGALVAIDPNTGEILAFVGSANFYDEDIDGQVNMVLSQTRQPGSAIKPLTYVAAFEKGWTASTLIWDVPSEFPPSEDPYDTNPPYEPVNYDEKFHGPVTVRAALANSYNIPAVKALEYVGIYDDPETEAEEGLIAFAERLGITSLTRSDYGLSLTLGGGEVSLLELSSAYTAFANEGRKMPTVAITRIVDHTGNVVYEHEASAGDQVIRSEHAYLISSILSDTAARTPMFGTDPVINLDFTAAVKTGTTNDFRDNWTIGYTSDLVVGVWVGNTDYTPMENTTGLTGAGPIWAEFMTYAVDILTGDNPSAFTRPSGIVDRVICAISGTEPSEWCPKQTSELFASDQLPESRSEDLWKKVTIDTWTGLGASEACSEFTDQKFAVNVDDKWAKAWLKDDGEGQAWAKEMGFSTPLFFVPERECTASDPHVIISLAGISDGDVIRSDKLKIRGVITATSNFDYYKIDWGKGSDPVSWKKLVKKEETPQESEGLLYEWDLSEMEPGIITLRIYVHSTEDTYAEKLIKLNIQVPTPTPTNTPSATPTPTNTPSATPTPSPTMSPSPTQTQTPTSSPTSTPTSTSTETQTPTSTQTPEAIETPTLSPTPTFTSTPT